MTPAIRRILITLQVAIPLGAHADKGGVPNAQAMGPVGFVQIRAPGAELPAHAGRGDGPGPSFPTFPGGGGPGRSLPAAADAAAVSAVTGAGKSGAFVLDAAQGAAPVSSTGADAPALSPDGIPYCD